MPGAIHAVKRRVVGRLHYLDPGAVYTGRLDPAARRGRGELGAAARVDLGVHVHQVREVRVHIRLGERPRNAA